MKNEELTRIEHNNNGEEPKTTKIIIKAKNVENVDKVLMNTKEIMKTISKYAYTNTWPTDVEWESILPKWFVESMTLKSSDDRDKDNNLWHYESWVDNIRMRAWVWWSSKKTGKDLEFVLETLSIPYLFESFIYILYSQGVSMENISFIDDID
ncbi:hypothetical protein [Chryseobacterium sp.]|uniref:hypothetical protein n=1 Tax=Chryseobacterium sp. TaxID=1871047 RepID=UPI0012A8E21A|nr:hypothetical protein [Chryseobacterium sp.]QFG54460.1 hypothetical protein F7R58_12655 [Chryseobacterium sp.]